MGVSKHQGWLPRRHPSRPGGAKRYLYRFGVVAATSAIGLLGLAVSSGSANAAGSSYTVDGTFSCSGGVETGTITGTGYGANQVVNSFVTIGGTDVARDVSDVADGSGNYTSSTLSFTPGAATTYTLEIRRPRSGPGSVLATTTKTVNCSASALPTGPGTAQGTATCNANGTVSIAAAATNLVSSTGHNNPGGYYQGGTVVSDSVSKQFTPLTYTDAKGNVTFPAFNYDPSGHASATFYVESTTSSGGVNLPFTVSFPSCAPPPASHKVTLCHARPADTAKNGWVVITIDDNGVQGDKKLAGHANEHDADIIPAFTYSNGAQFTGKNLGDLSAFGHAGVTGQQVLANGCKLPATSPTTPPTQSPTTPPTKSPTSPSSHHPTPGSSHSTTPVPPVNSATPPAPAPSNNYPVQSPTSGHGTSFWDKPLTLLSLLLMFLGAAVAVMPRGWLKFARRSH